MSCPGLHCPGCSGGQSLGVLAGTGGVLLVAYETVAIVAEHIWEIAGTLAVCFVLAVAAGMWLERWHDRRGAEWGAARGIMSRADVILPPTAPVLTAEPVRPALPVIENHYHVHFHGADAAAAILRKDTTG